MKCKQNYINI